MIKMNNEKVINTESNETGTLLAMYGSNMMCLCVVRVGNNIENWFSSDVKFIEEIEL